MIIPLDSIWSMEETAFNKMIAQLQAGMQAFIGAGPADEAERDRLPIQVLDNIAVVSLVGPIIKRDGFFSRFFGFASSQSFMRAVQAAHADDRVEQIVLRVDSPGGSVDGLSEAADAVAAAAKDKPVIAQVDGINASAAYFISSQATTIVSGRSDIIGSIGVRTMLYDYSAAFEEAGIKAIPIDTGEFKSAGALGTEITKRQQADFQRVVDAYFADFKDAVMRGRNMSSAKFDAIADGRVFHAQEALQLGLIDGIQTMDDTLASLHQRRPMRRKTKAARSRLALMARA